MIPRRSIDSRRTYRGFSLVEVLVVLTIMGVLVAMPMPLFLRSMEQSKFDVATANLRAIWSAQRLYYLANGRYGSLNDLSPGISGTTDLIDPSIVSGATYYVYSIDVSIDGQSFMAQAEHPAGSLCFGTVTIDQTGTLTSAVTYNGQAMTPSLEPGT